MSFHRYAYVRFNPINRIDPSGNIDCNLLGGENCADNGVDFVDEGSGYDREKVPFYATKLWQEEEERDYGEYDCTNYVSDVMCASGMQMDTSGDDKGWEKPDNGNPSTSWRNTSAFYDYWSNPDRGTVLNIPVLNGVPDLNLLNEKFTELQVGDIVIYDWADTEYEMDHAAIITDFTLYQSSEGSFLLPQVSEHSSWNIDELPRNIHEVKPGTQIIQMWIIMLKNK
jgi:hypothetical protein